MFQFVKLTRVHILNKKRSICVCKMKVDTVIGCRAYTVQKKERAQDKQGIDNKTDESLLIGVTLIPSCASVGTSILNSSFSFSSPTAPVLSFIILLNLYVQPTSITPEIILSRLTALSLDHVHLGNNPECPEVQGNLARESGYMNEQR